MKKDRAWSNFFADAERFADAINGFGCNGEQIVSAKDLYEVDTQLKTDAQLKFVYKGSKDEKQKYGRFRDLVKKIAFGVNYCIIGIENQDEIDYSIPIRNMGYDVRQYSKQLSQIQKDVRSNTKGLSSGEYMYGFRQNSRLYPVVTFILYSGEEEWNGPNSLHDILDFTEIPDKLHKFVPNYKINIINIRKIEDTSVFRTDLKHVLDFLRFSKDKNKLINLVKSNPYYSQMDEDAVDVIAAYANVEKLVETKKYYIAEGKMDMCQAIKELIEDGRLEGRLEGKVIGIIKTARRYHAKDSEIVEQLMEELQLDEERARMYLLNTN